MNNKRRLTTLVLAIAMMVFGIQYAKAEKVETTNLHYISSSGGLNDQGADKLFDGGTGKWCNTAPQLGATAYVIFSSEQIGKLTGYYITAGNDNETYNGRNPKDWKIYGSNDNGVNKQWTLLHSVENDNVLEDRSHQCYTYTIENGNNTYFKYFKWEITKNKGAVAFQVEEFALELEVCTHSGILGDATDYAANCICGSYKGQLCSICGHVVNKTDESEEKNANNHVHKIKHDVSDATCTENGVVTAYWECRDCGKYFSDEACTAEITDLSAYISIPTGHTFGADGKCAVCPADKDPLMDLLNTNGVNFVSTEYNEYPWVTSTKEGMTGIMSNNVGQIYTKSQMNIKLSCDQPFLLSFDYEVSSIRDKYTIYVDGVREVYEINGETSGEYGKILEKGVHVISLTFAKENATDNFYDDRAYLYNFLATTDLSKSPQEPRVVLSNDGTLTFYNKGIAFYYNQQKEGNSIYTIEDSQFPTWDDKKTDIKKVVFDDSFVDQYPSSCENWFSNCSNLTAIEGLRNLNTGRVRRFFICN